MGKKHKKCCRTACNQRGTVRTADGIVCYEHYNEFIKQNPSSRGAVV